MSSILNGGVRCARRLSLVALLVSGGVNSACAQFVPNEQCVSPAPGLIDFEFSQPRHRLAFTDPSGRLWLGKVDPSTGAFDPTTGTGQLLATGTVAKQNMFKWNGPEWVSMSTGEQIAFSYYVPGKPKIADNTRMAVLIQDSTGGWVKRTLSPELPRMMHVTSKNPGDPNPTIRYLDPYLNHYWRNLKDANSEVALPFLPPSNRAWRFVSGLRALLYTAPVDGISQVISYQLDTAEHTQLTFDDGDKDTDRSVPWMWKAPDFDDDFIFITVANGAELRAYRKLDQPDGSRRWTVIYRGSVGAGRSIGSPEWFIYNGKSYVSMAVFIEPNTYPTEVWVSNLDAAAPLMRRVTVDSPVRVRNDPEVYITDKGPRVYYNRYDPAIDPEHPLCNTCSEGVYTADPGLAGR